ncbi:MAG: methylmalonyl-CoA mutase, partial [Candidatus Marinimicrobia bacterium]|nr:methylmalonyl-CoA mutase [Candidatus Neomarinimicrobiota bacterium]
EILEIDSKKVESQIESVKSLKISRNNDQVSQRLSELKLAAQSAENVMPPIIDCVKNECTLGEIADTLRDVFGIHQGL